MNTPPPWVGGQIGYGETNSTRGRSGCRSSGEKRSWKIAGRERRKTSVSETALSERARQREPVAPKICAAARRKPRAFVRPGAFPDQPLTIEPANAKTKL